VLLTDLPRRAGTQPIVSEYSTSRGVGLVSVPALGAFRLKHLEKAVRYNASTLLTLFLSVAAMYAILYMLTLLAAATPIDAGDLQSTLGHPVGATDYAKLVWPASAVAIVAGALGSSLDSEEAIRKAIYSKREQERQARNRDI
jgi:hypothetical protein